MTKYYFKAIDSQNNVSQIELSKAHDQLVKNLELYDADHVLDKMMQFNKNPNLVKTQLLKETKSGLVVLATWLPPEVKKALKI